MRALDVQGLTAGYGRADVVRGLDLHVEQGEIVALLGRNGAGKTTTLSAIAGFLSRSVGTVTVCGRSLDGPPHARARHGLGIVLEGRSAFASLSVRQNLTIADVSVEDALQLFPELGRRLTVSAGSLSGGEQQMLSVARALGRRPSALLVDELSFGLAPTVCHRMFVRLRQVASETGTGILLVEQQLASAALVADRALVLNEGQLVLEVPGDEIVQRAEEIEQIYLAMSLDDAS